MDSGRQISGLLGLQMQQQQQQQPPQLPAECMGFGSKKLVIGQCQSPSKIFYNEADRSPSFGNSPQRGVILAQNELPYKQAASTGYERKSYELDYILRNRIIPILEDKLSHPFEQDKDQWVCEVVEIIREFKSRNLKGEDIYNKDYGMLFEEIYDSFLTLSKKNNRDYKFVLNMLKRTLKEIDEKVLQYYHDYSRIKGEKLKINREKYEKAFGVNKDMVCIKIEDGSSYGNGSNSEADTVHAPPGFDLESRTNQGITDIAKTAASFYDTFQMKTDIAKSRQTNLCIKQEQITHQQHGLQK